MVHGITGHNFETRHPSDDSDQVWFPLVLYFQRRRFLKRFTTYDGDGRQVMAIAHMTLWVRWAKKWRENIEGIFKFLLGSFKNRMRSSLVLNTVDSCYLEFDGTMDKIWVNCSSTQGELWKYRKCSLFNDERETTRVKFWRAKTSIACPYSRNDFKHIRCFCCCFFLC